MFLDWLYLTPGIYTLFLALVAGVIPAISRWFEHSWVKISYTVVFGIAMWP